MPPLVPPPSDVLPPPPGLVVVLRVVGVVGIVVGARRDQNEIIRQICKINHVICTS